MSKKPRASWIETLTPALSTRSAEVGDKAARLAVALASDLPVSQGFVITQSACAVISAKLPKELQLNLREVLTELASQAGGTYGDPSRPLLLALRISAPENCPNPVDGILNVGLNDGTLAGLAQSSGDPRFAAECYRHFIQNYAHVVLGDDPVAFEEVLALFCEERGYLSEHEITGNDARELVSRFKGQYAANNSEAFPEDVFVQLEQSILALLRAWRAPRARAQRRLQGAAEDASCAIFVQAMTFGNLGEDSGMVRVTSRDAATGQAHVSGRFVKSVQGPDLSMKLAQAQDFSSLPDQVRKVLQVAVNKLESALGEPLDMECVLSRGVISIVAVKKAKLSTSATLNTLVDLVAKGHLQQEQALLRIDPISLDQLLHTTLSPDAVRQILATGLPASPGAVSGQVIFDAEEARKLAAAGEAVILVRPETLPEDIRGLHAADGVLTTRGGMTSHAAVIARGMGKPCVAGASTLRIDVQAGTLSGPSMVVNKGDMITLDGSTGQVLIGQQPVLKPQLSGNFATLLTWADAHRRMGVRANAETVQDARMARDLGAEGIGLCRSEHMFFEGERLLAIREMILADREKDRRAALAKTLPMLRADFAALFEIMAGLPVTLRLLDPPLHEFLPDAAADVEALARAIGTDVAATKRRIHDMHEQNPMLGHRGVRLLLSFPEIVDMQARAIFEAVTDVIRTTGRPPIPEIMVPLVVSRAEFDQVRVRIDAAAREVQSETGMTFDFRVGTMIELPRAALRAGDIAQSAEFFSFGTNDLTQTTFGISRDDSARFIGEYTARGIFTQDPFVSIDIDGVGELLELAVKRGRKSRPGIHLGICGEHGGDPKSIAFCEALGLDYVSCSPFRVPIARLAAAQASLRKLQK